MPTISKKRLIDVVNRSMTRCYFVEDDDRGFYERHAASKAQFRHAINERSEYDLECTLRFAGFDVELRQLDTVHINDPEHRRALRVFINEKLAEANLWQACQLDYVTSMWVDKATLIMNGWKGNDAENIIRELISIGALDKLSTDGPILLTKAAYRTAEREKWNLDQ